MNEMGLHFSYVPDFNYASDFQDEKNTPSEAPLNNSNLHIYSLADLQDGDVVLSNQILREIFTLMDFKNFHVPSKSWFYAKLLVSLASYLEAYITQNRILFMVEDNDLIIKKINAFYSLNFDISLLKIPDLWNPEIHRVLLTPEDVILYETYKC